ncbi:MAG: hypothetical protein JW759_09355 [Candidatus Coatesbacteria bacterium]|nr:hypothetical protein [Candidatus Coatesbacteria bacterium]
MLLKDIVDAVNANVLAGGEILPQREITTVSACDLMSDVLAFAKPGILLVTGLANSQVVRTAAVAQLSGVIIVRGKRPGAETIELAKRMRVPLLSTSKHMFELCSELFKIGLVGTSSDRS